jgi:rubrerythrin
MTPEDHITLYLLLLLAGLLALVVHWEFRRRRFRATAAPDRIFRCEKCGYTYTDDPDVDLSKCPHCNAMNEPFQF